MENFDLKKYLTEGKFTKTYLKENQDSTGIVAKFSKYKPLIDLDGTHKQVTFQIQGNLQDEDFQAAKKHLIDQGYEVNQDQSHNDYMEDDDRNIYPRIIFKEVVNEEEAIKENKSLAEIEEAGYKAGEKASYTYATVVTRLQNRPDKLRYNKGFIQGVKDELGSSLNEEDVKKTIRSFNESVVTEDKSKKNRFLGIFNPGKNEFQRKIINVNTSVIEDLINYTESNGDDVERYGKHVWATTKESSKIDQTVWSYDGEVLMFGNPNIKSVYDEYINKFNESENLNESNSAKKMLNSLVNIGFGWLKDDLPDNYDLDDIRKIMISKGYETEWKDEWDMAFDPRRLSKENRTLREGTNFDYDYADIGQFYLEGLNKPFDLTEDELKDLGESIVRTLYKGDIKAAYDDIVHSKDLSEDTLEEALNPEVSQKVNQFIKAMAKRYGYSEQDAVYAIMAALKQREYGNVNEDLDIGHEDNEPGMLKADLYKIGKQAMELYQIMDNLEGKGEIDFPHWWQSKINTAKNMIDGAKHYLEFEINEPAIDATIDAVDMEESIDREFHTTPKTNGHPNWKNLSAVEIQDYIDANPKTLWGRELRTAKMVIDQLKNTAVTEDTSLNDEAKAYFMGKVKKGEIDTLPEDPKAEYLAQMTKDQIEHDEETLDREGGLEEDSFYTDDIKNKVVSKLMDQLKK